MASKSRRSTQADDDEVEYVPLPARKGLSVPDPCLVCGSWDVFQLVDLTTHLLDANGI